MADVAVNVEPSAEPERAPEVQEAPAAEAAPEAGAQRSSVASEPQRASVADQPQRASLAEEKQKPKAVGFDVEDGAQAHAPKTEEVDDIKAAAAKGRQTTFQKLRMTLKEGAEEVGSAVADATSFTLANTVESIVVAIARVVRKEGNWHGPSDLALSEAFILLWVDKNGGIAGRQNSATLQAILYGAILCDLIACGKLDVQKFNKKMGPMSWERHVVSPTGPEALNNFLDPAFQAIKESYDRRERRTIAKWVEVVATSVNEGTETVDDVVFSLCDKDILKEEKKSLLGIESRKWPVTENGRKIVEDLISALRKVLLDDEPPTPWIKSFLRLIRAADSDFMFQSPFIDKVLKTKAEKQKAEKLLKASEKLDGEKEAK